VSTVTEIRNRNTHIILIILLYVSFLISYGVYYVTIEFVDFPTFFYAANAVFVERESPYESGTLTHEQISSDQTIFPFLYPPPSLLVFYPLSCLTYESAAIVTLIANHLFLVLFLYLFLFKILDLTLRHSFITLAIAYVLLYHPVAVTLDHGQVNLFVLVLLCFAWLGIKNNSHPAMVALPLSLAILVKTYPALILLLLIVKKRYRDLFGVLGFLGLFSLAAYLVLPQSVWSDWIGNILPTSGYGQIPFNLFSPAAPWNQSINGFTSRLFLKNEFSETLIPSPWAARTVPYIISALIMLVTFAIIYADSSISEARHKVNLQFSLLLAAMYLVAPLSWEHHLVFVLPAAIVALNLLLDSREKGVLELVVILSILLLAWRFPMWITALRNGVLTLVISLKFYAVACLWAFLSLVLWRRLNNSTCAVSK
jgi:alpha-1,2-mannosyltransferase